jgi:hypothetical protein
LGESASFVAPVPLSVFSIIIIIHRKGADCKRLLSRMRCLGGLFRGDRKPGKRQIRKRKTARRRFAFSLYPLRSWHLFRKALCLSDRHIFQNNAGVVLGVSCGQTEGCRLGTVNRAERTRALAFWGGG